MDLAYEIVGVSPAQAAVATDAVTTAYHAVTRRAEVKQTETVFLFGLGGLGFNALQIIRDIGARVIVSDPRQERLDAAASIGVPLSDMVPIGMDIQDYVKYNQLIIDTTIDFAGTAQTLDDAQNIGMKYSPGSLKKIDRSSSNCWKDCLYRNA